MNVLRPVFDTIWLLGLLILAIPLLIIFGIIVVLWLAYIQSSKIAYRHSIYKPAYESYDFKRVVKENIKSYRYVIHEIYYDDGGWDIEQVRIKGYKFRFLKEKDKTWCILKSKC